jgi:hypothetical protein
MDMVFCESVSEDRAGMIQDNGVSFAFGRAQHPTDHLPVQPHLFCRPSQNAAACLGLVPALCQNCAVRDELDVAGCQAAKSRIAFGLWCLASDVLGPHTGSDEFIAQVYGVRDVDRERRRLPPGRRNRLWG